MEIQGYQFSDSVEKIYEETRNTAPELELNVQIAENLDTEDGGRCRFDREGNCVIQLDRSSVSDYTLSHQLLHCMFIRKGYPRLRTISTENNIINYFALQTENCLMHKLICEEQDRRGISREEDLNRAQAFLERVGQEPPNPEAHFFFCMKLLDMMIRSGGNQEQFDLKFRINFRNSHKFAARLYERAMAKEFNTPFETRRAMIRVLKELDRIIAEKELEPLELDRNVAAGFIPSERQLDQNVFELFDFYKDELTDAQTGEKVWILVSRAEDQTSFFVLPGENFEQSISEMTLKDFFQEVGLTYLLR